jgi:pimeloyl-ACP methyl ester carboxylesterase
MTKACPVVYLPGASGSSRVWAATAARLGHRESILLDYPGLGDERAVAEIQSLDDLARWLCRGLPASFDLVSLSMGSAIALRLALLAPERVRRVVLVTPAGGVDVAALGATDWRDGFCRRRPTAPRWFVDDHVDLSSQLGRVAQRTLLLLGECDVIAPPSVGRHLSELLPSARFEVIANATHDLEDEQPDLVSQWIEMYLSRP